MPAGLAIHRLSARTPARAQPVAARLALQALGADLEDAVPRGLPPQALLWLRRLRLQAPEAALLRPAPGAWRQDWIAAGREQLDAALAQAARPALGPVPDSAPAVLFADAAEMLACLALAAQRGQLDRWWWRGLLGRGWPQWQPAWAARPEAQAAAQRLLARAGQGDPGGGLRDEALVMRAAGAAGPPTRAGDAAVRARPAVAPLPDTRSAPPLPALARPAATPSAGRHDDPDMPHRPQPAPADGAHPTTPADAARREPSTLEAPAPRPREAGARPLVGKPPAAVAAGLPERPAAAAPVPVPPEERAAAAAPPAASTRHRPQAVARAVPAGPLPDAALPPAAAPAPAAVDEQLPARAALPSPTADAMPAMRPAALPRRRAPAPAPAPLATPVPRDEPPRPQSPAVDAPAAWPWPQALASRQAPLLFIVNALLEDGLYPDFTRPRDPGLPVPPWALLAALARAWRLPGDPLQAALLQHCVVWTPPREMPAAPGAPAGPWPAWLAAYARTLRRRLCRRLGRRPAAWPQALTLARPARLWLSEAEWVAEFPLDSHDVAWRLAGLDRDPGWLPRAGCSLRFVFV